MSFGRALIRLLAAERPARAVAICRIGIGLAAFIIGLKTAHDLFLLRRPEFVRAPPFDWMPASSRPVRFSPSRASGLRRLSASSSAIARGGAHWGSS